MDIKLCRVSGKGYYMVSASPFIALREACSFLARKAQRRRGPPEMVGNGFCLKKTEYPVLQTSSPKIRLYNAVDLYPFKFLKMERLCSFERVRAYRMLITSRT